MSFDGDTLGDGASGTFTANNIETYDRNTNLINYGNMGSVTIRGYTAVTIGSVYTYCSHYWNYAGSLTITGIVNNINISGDINLLGRGLSGVFYKGDLRLYAGGSITVGNLNLSNLTYAVFDGGGKSYIEGLLTGSDGNPASGLGNIGTKLRTPAGKTIYYKPEASPALNGQSFVLASPAGVPGEGGLLKPKPKGTVVRFY